MAAKKNDVVIFLKSPTGKYGIGVGSGAKYRVTDDTVREEMISSGWAIGLVEFEKEAEAKKKEEAKSIKEKEAIQTAATKEVREKEEEAERLRGALAASERKCESLANKVNKLTLELRDSMSTVSAANSKVTEAIKQKEAAEGLVAAGTKKIEELTVKVAGYESLNKK